MENEKLTDAALIQHLAGKPSKQNMAIRQLLNDRKIKGAIFNYTKQYQLQQQDREDITQDAIIILIEKIEKGAFEGRSQLSTFLIGIAMKLCQQKARENKKVDYMESEKIVMDGQTQSQEMELIEMESQKEFADVKRRLFQKLSNKCRKVLILASNGYSREEIAEAMEWSNVQTAKNSVPECRKRLRKIIEGSSEFLNIVKSNI